MKADAIDIEEMKGYLKIDQFNLDEDIVQHPSLFFKVAEAYVDAVATRDTLKEKLGTRDAELNLSYRDEFADRGMKTTDKAIESSVLTDPDHMALATAYAKAKATCDKLGVLKEAFTTRGFMLRDLCNLAVAHYFESDSVRSSSNTKDFVEKKAHERMHAKRQHLRETGRD
jgi:alkylation response protein AidB-like acyl-CoA dehydrogenase